MPLAYVHKLLSQYNVYFLNGSHFTKFPYVVLLTTWLSLEPSYLLHTQKKLCSCGQYSESYKFLEIFTFSTFSPCIMCTYNTQNTHTDTHTCTNTPDHQHLWTVVLAIGLITETSCLPHIYTYAPSIDT